MSPRIDDQKDRVAKVMQELYALNRIYDIGFDADLLSYITTQVGAEWIAECAAAAAARPIKAADMRTRMHADPVTLAHRADHLHRDSASSSSSSSGAVVIPVSSAAITSSNSSRAVMIPVSGAAINAGPNISYTAGLVKSKKKRQSSAIAVDLAAEASHSNKARKS